LNYELSKGIQTKMKKLALSFFVLFLFIASVTSSVKAEIDGSMLLENCNEAVRYMQNKNAPSPNFSAVNFCVGYISGVNDLHTTFVRSVACFDPPLFCNPQPAEIERLVKIVVEFLKAHPEDLHFQGSVLTVSALKEAFPCTYNTSQK
jgi:hypothetical protein